MVLIEQLEGGGVMVSRVFPCLSSAQAGAIALERINPDGFRGSPPPPGTTLVNPPSTEDGS